MEAQAIVKDKNDVVKTEAVGRERAVLAWKDEYEKGDRIIFSLPGENRFYIMHANNTINEASIYGAGNEPVYEVPFAEGKMSYNPKSFTGEHHCLVIRYVRNYKVKPYRNLAKNVVNRYRGQKCYPHAHANVGVRGEAMSAVRNAVDGVMANLFHGEWPYGSRGINMQDDVQMTLEFGHPVDFNQIVLYIRADFPHDNWQERTTFTFSDGTSRAMELEKSVEPRIVSLERRGITWLTFGQLMETDNPPPLPALIQTEVHGREHGVTLQGPAGSGMKETE